jgi:hypothetical protein
MKPLGSTCGSRIAIANPRDTLSTSTTVARLPAIATGYQSDHYQTLTVAVRNSPVMGFCRTAPNTGQALDRG